MPTCTVYVRDPETKQMKIGHVTDGTSLFAACRNALAWFESPHTGKVHVFSDDTVLEVARVGQPEKIWYVRAGDVRRAKLPETQQVLFAPDARGAFDPQH